MPTTTPNSVSRTSTRACMAATTSLVVVVVGQAGNWWGANPHLTLMLFGMLLGASIVTGVAAVLARCHLSIAEAFMAGHATARATPAPPAPRTVAPLRAVD